MIILHFHFLYCNNPNDYSFFLTPKGFTLNYGTQLCVNVAPLCTSIATTAGFFIFALGTNPGLCFKSENLSPLHYGNCFSYELSLITLHSRDHNKGTITI